MLIKMLRRRRLLEIRRISWCEKVEGVAGDVFVWKSA